MFIQLFFNLLLLYASKFLYFVLASTKTTMVVLVMKMYHQHMYHSFFINDYNLNLIYTFCLCASIVSHIVFCFNTTNNYNNNTIMRTKDMIVIHQLCFNYSFLSNYSHNQIYTCLCTFIIFYSEAVYGDGDTTEESGTETVINDVSAYT